MEAQTWKNVLRYASGGIVNPTAVEMAKYRFVGWDGNFAAGTDAIGVLDDETPAGAPHSINIQGTCLVEAGAVLPVGAKVEAGADGVAVAAAGARALARVITPASAVGQPMEILLADMAQ